MQSCRAAACVSTANVESGTGIPAVSWGFRALAFREVDPPSSPPGGTRLYPEGGGRGGYWRGLEQEPGGDPSPYSDSNLGGPLSPRAQAGRPRSGFCQRAGASPQPSGRWPPACRRNPEHPPTPPPPPPCLVPGDGITPSSGNVARQPRTPPVRGSCVGARRAGTRWRASAPAAAGVSRPTIGRPVISALSCDSDTPNHRRDLIYPPPRTAGRAHALARARTPHPLARTRSALTLPATAGTPVRGTRKPTINHS